MYYVLVNSNVHIICTYIVLCVLQCELFCRESLVALFAVGREDDSVVEYGLGELDEEREREMRRRGGGN